PDQRPEHGDLLRTREALGPPDPPAPGRPDPPDRVLPDLRDDRPRIERPDPVRRRRGRDPEPDDPVQARLLQLDVLPVVHRTFTAGSTPLPGVRITVTDELGTPHYLTTTDASGRYSAVLPFGDITITASSGSLTRTTLIGTRTLASAKVHVTVEQAMRSPADA